jgi:hypothetical protein
MSLMESIVDKKVALLLTLFSFISLAESAWAGPKTFLFSLPLVSVGREGAIRAEYNATTKGSLALEWSEWGMGREREELTANELEKHPKDSLITQGREILVMMSKYSNQANLSGLYWGLGLGYRSGQAQWTKTADADEIAGAGLQAGQLEHKLDVVGPTVAARGGYRFVGEDLGFAVGSYLGVKRTQNKVTDAKNASDETRSFAATKESDRLALKNRFATSLTIGIDIGWAF